MRVLVISLFAVALMGFLPGAAEACPSGYRSCGTYCCR